MCHPAAIAPTLLLIAGLLAGVVLAADERPAPPDLIIHSGYLHTVDEAHPRAEAVAIRGDRIMAVGSNRDILPLAGDSTRLIDATGRFVMPGFNDNHVHFASAARFLEFNIMKVSTQEEFRRRLREVIDRLTSGEWILGGFWGAYDAWTPGSTGGQAREPFHPDVRAIEDLTREHPLFIRRFDDSEFAANTKALREVGLDPADPRATGVTFIRDRQGRFTGRMRGEGVLALFEPHLPASFSVRRRLAQTRRALDEIRRHGVTSISDMSDDRQLEIYRRLHRNGELTVRVHFRYPLERWQELSGREAEAGAANLWIRLGALKGHIDGIMGNSTARFFEPYSHQPDNHGRWRRLMLDDEGKVAPGRFLDYMQAADAAGLQLTVHAIGDEANHVLLDNLAQVIERNGRRDRRFRLVHAQVMAPRDFRRLGKLGVVAEVQPFHLSDDMRWMEERIGRRRCRGAYAFRSLLEGGAVLSFGTDWPGTAAAEYPIDPMNGLYAAVTRQTLAGRPEGGWYPEQRLSIEEAIRAYTWGTAYANFQDDVLGSIQPGKLADLVILARNLLEIPPAGIPGTGVVATLVGGRIVYLRDTEPGARSRAGDLGSRRGACTRSGNEIVRSLPAAAGEAGGVVAFR